MYGEGISEYEAASIAQREAQAACDSLRFEVMQEVRFLQQDVSELQQEIRGLEERISILESESK